MTDNKAFKAVAEELEKTLSPEELEETKKALRNEIIKSLLHGHLKII